MPSREFPGRLDALPAIGRFISKAARQAGLNDEDVYDVELSVIEACTNIIEHGYHCEGEQKITCTWVIIPRGIKVILKDSAFPFDPKCAPPPQIGVALEELQPRGVGVFLMLRLMDDVQHAYAPGKGNTLTIIKRRSINRRHGNRPPGRGLPVLRRGRKRRLLR